MRNLFLGATLLLAPGFFAPALAQDSHYWTNQYGTRAELLGGTVVGSIKDLSCVYYNPGAMALVADPELILTTDAFQLESIRLEDAAGRGIDLTSLDSGKAPSIFAVRLGIEPLAERGLAFSVITRQDFRVNLDAHRITPADDPIDDRYFSGEINFNQRLNETWFGASWARKVDQFGIGVTGFGAYRSQSGRGQTLILSSDDVEGSSLVIVDSFSYWHARLLAKIGVSWDWNPYAFGVTVTTPGLSLVGQGSRLVTVSSVDIEDSQGGTIEELVSNYQDGLAARYNSPFSIAVGGSWRFTERTTIHTTVEWFKEVDDYLVMDSSSFVGQTTGQPVETDLRHQARPVFNWGIGLDHALTEGVELYGGFWTDRSSYVGEEESQLSSTSWNIYHATFGSNFRWRTVRFTLGVGLARGTGELERTINLRPEDSQLFDQAVFDTRYLRLKGIVGVSFDV